MLFQTLGCPILEQDSIQNTYKDWLVLEVVNHEGFLEDQMCVLKVYKKEKYNYTRQ